MPRLPNSSALITFGCWTSHHPSHDGSVAFLPHPLSHLMREIHHSMERLTVTATPVAP